ncbi:helix-turn-helix domain-containing protein [Vibrio sp. R78045]|uniref:helix-turn-helix domain-containing protein n=1 Tax=Vibrio sp. R78045 TaxID=3093868 RepID=UPI0036F2E403
MIDFKGQKIGWTDLSNRFDIPISTLVNRYESGLRDEELVSNTHQGCGNKRASNKLTESDVREIKIKLQTAKLTQSSIAKQYNVHPSHISDIKRGKRWADIETGDSRMTTTNIAVTIEIQADIERTQSETSINKIAAITQNLVNEAVSTGAFNEQGLAVQSVSMENPTIGINHAFYTACKEALSEGNSLPNSLSYKGEVFNYTQYMLILTEQQHIELNRICFS